MLTNRTKKINFQIRFPQIVVLAFLSTLLMVSCRDIGGGLIEKGTDKILTNQNTIIDFKNIYKRYYRLYNHCSHHHLEIIGNSVTAKGSVHSNNSKLIVQQAKHKNTYGINIIGEKSGRYLCFNRKSKLIARFAGSNPRCIFEEEFNPSGMYILLRSVYNPEWYVGFNKKGRHILGSEYGNLKRDRRCFHFTSRGHSYLDNLHKYRHQGVKIHNPEKFQEILKEKRLDARSVQHTR